MEIIFLVAYIFTLLLQIFFYLIAFFSLLKAKTASNFIDNNKKFIDNKNIFGNNENFIYNKKKFTFVSIIICARNEATNLKNHLPNFLRQQYQGNWELIVVDDDSGDDSLAILADFKQQYPERLRVLALKNKSKAGKKTALKAGIIAARGEWILLSDADCCPNSLNWLNLMIQKGIENSKREIVLGFSPYRGKNSLLSAWIGYETALTGLQYLSFAAWGRAYMGVGRNLLYKKQLFLDKNSFDEDTLASGDDDLFINKASNSQNTSFCLHKDSFCISNPPQSWTALYGQKKRHFAAGNFYPNGAKVKLFILAQSHFWAHTGLLFFLTFGSINWAIFSLWLLRNLVVWGLMGYICKRIFGYKKNLSLLPFFDLAVPIYYCIFALLFTNSQKKIEWK